MSITVPAWVPAPDVVLAQLASGLIEYAESDTRAAVFRLPYPATLQRALDRLTLLAWHQNERPPSSVVELVQWAGRPFADWPMSIPDAQIDPEESLLAFGRPTGTCLELGSLRGDVEGELRENLLIGQVLDKTRAAGSPVSYVAFRRLLIERPVLTALELDTRLATAELSPLADQLRQAYAQTPPEAAADGVIRTCAGCAGLLLPWDDRAWVCVDTTCPEPGRPGPTYPAADGTLWLRRELRTFITGPGRAELRIAKKVQALGAAVELWPDFDAWDLSVFTGDAWVADVKAWRNPTRLGHALARQSLSVPPGARGAFIVIAREQLQGQQRYLDRLRAACPQVRRGQRIEAITEREFLKRVATEHGRRS